MADNEDDYEPENENEKDSGRSVAKVTPTQLAALKQLGDAATAAVAAHPRGSTEPLLRMRKGDGVWIYGVDDTQIEPNSEWAINPFACQHGWIAWNPDPKAVNRKLGERMALITAPMPDQLSLPDVGGAWSEQFSLLMRCMNGQDMGLQLIYKTNALGGKDACLDLIGKIGERARSGETRVVPVVQLGHGSYTHPSYGLIHKPIFKVVRWLGMGEDEGGGGEPKPKPSPGIAEEPVRRRRAAA